jgi:hypothetical protein
LPAGSGIVQLPGRDQRRLDRSTRALRAPEIMREVNRAVDVSQYRIGQWLSE